MSDILEPQDRSRFNEFNEDTIYGRYAAIASPGRAPETGMLTCQHHHRSFSAAARCARKLRTYLVCYDPEQKLWDVEFSDGPIDVVPDGIVWEVE